jgi:hypothetical protein
MGHEEIKIKSSYYIIILSELSEEPLHRLYLFFRYKIWSMTLAEGDG